MAENKQMQICLQGPDVMHQTGQYRWQALATADRLRSAGMGVGMCLLVGLLTLPIPIIHFVVPAGALAIAPVVAYLQFRKTRIPVVVNGKCPNCHCDIDIMLESADTTLPLHKYCPLCDKPIRILES